MNKVTKDNIEIIILLIVVFIIRYTFARTLIWYSNWLVIFLTILVNVTGVILTASFTSILLLAIQEKSWPTTTGIVTRSEITGSRAIIPTIDYSYTVKDITHQETSHVHAPMFGGKRKKYDVAKTLVNEYPVGKKLTVYYNSENPGNSTITPGPTWELFVKIAVSVLLTGGGFFIFLTVRVRK